MRNLRFGLRNLRALFSPLLQANASQHVFDMKTAVQGKKAQSYFSHQLGSSNALKIKCFSGYPALWSISHYYRFITSVCWRSVASCVRRLLTFLAIVNECETVKKYNIAVAEDDVLPAGLIIWKVHCRVPRGKITSSVTISDTAGLGFTGGVSGVHVRVGIVGAVKKYKERSSIRHSRE